jgi:hypothetical protein
MFVVTADQKRSRTAIDRVPALLEDLKDLKDLKDLADPKGPRQRGDRAPGPTRTSRPFERTAGDEVQGLLTDPAAVVDAVVTLLRGGWWVGVGIGAIDQPWPETARAGRGPAYLAARQAVESAKGVPTGICVVATAAEAGQRAEAAAWLLAAVVGRRTAQGWQVVDLVAVGAKGVEVAAKLGISPQAVSSRLRVSGWTEEQRGRELLTWLLGQADREAMAQTAPPTREEVR